MNLTTTLLIGACMQSCLLFLLPKFYGMAPAALILTAHLMNTVLITLGYKGNPYLEDVIMKKTSAQVPDQNGNFGEAGGQKIAVLLLGAKSNHPLGAFAPYFGQVNTYVQQMTAQLEAGAQHNGCR